MRGLSGFLCVETYAVAFNSFKNSSTFHGIYIHFFNMGVLGSTEVYHFLKWVCFSRMSRCFCGFFIQEPERLYLHKTCFSYAGRNILTASVFRIKDVGYPSKED